MTRVKRAYYVIRLNCRRMISLNDDYALGNINQTSDNDLEINHDTLVLIFICINISVCLFEYYCTCFIFLSIFLQMDKSRLLLISCIVTTMLEYC